MTGLEVFIPELIGGIGAAAPGVATAAATGLATNALMKEGEKALYGDPAQKQRQAQEEYENKSRAQKLGALLGGNSNIGKVDMTEFNRKMTLPEIMQIPKPGY